MRGLLLGLALGACTGSVTAVDTDGEDAVEVRTWLSGSPTRGVGTLVVQVEADAGLKVDLPEPDVPGLRFSEVGDPLQERIGDRAVFTRTFRFTGEAGSYEIPALRATAGEGEAQIGAVSSPLWVDLGQEPPEMPDFQDIADPEPVYGLTSSTIVAGVCGGVTLLGVGGGIALAFWGLGRRSARRLPPEPPDVRALRQWDAIRTDASLDDHEKAVALAVLFREYVEAVLGFSATAWTTSEILQHLEAMTHLPEGNVGRARRILRATDRIKFADAAARATLFEELDEALRSFVGSTRPRGWQGDA